MSVREVLLLQAAALHAQANALEAVADGLGGEAPSAKVAPVPAPRRRRRSPPVRVVPLPPPGDPVDEVAKMRGRKTAETILRRKGYPV